MLLHRTLTMSLSGLALAAALGMGNAWAQSPDILAGISAGKVAVISDGEHLVSTYGDAVLSPAERGLKDTLTIFSIADGRVTQSALPVSNSVTSAPEILELTPDGRTAFVTERLGERTEGAAKVPDLAAGNRLFAIDVSDAQNPKQAGIAEVGNNPEALAISPDGGRVAVVSNTAEQSLLQIVSYADSAFGTVARFDLAELGVTGTAEAPRGGVLATNVQWHPSGRFLAVNITTQNRVAFFEIAGDGATPEIRPWGNIVETGRDPFVGRFTPDGNHYLTSNWGRDFSATTLEGRIPPTPSTMTVVRLGDVEADDPQHQALASVETGVSAEGMAVSPDGRLVATINMEDTSFPPGSPRHKREAAVSLLTFDPASGALEKVGDYPFEGMLPEGGTFDLTGDHLLVTVFEGHAGAAADKGSGVEVFRVTKDGAPALTSLGRVALPHGVHHVDVAP